MRMLKRKTKEIDLPIPYGKEHQDDIVNIALQFLEKRINKTKPLMNSDDIRNYLILKLGLLEYESFGVILLDNRNKVISFEPIFRGTINEITVYTREIIRTALLHNASRLVAVHNHPGGHCKPSASDRCLTEKLQETLEIMDITLLDHFIVADNKILSFVDKGYL